MSEGKYLSDMLAEPMVTSEEFVSEVKTDMHNTKQDYENNKVAPIGTECICPTCRRKFIKTTSKQAFCSVKRKNKSSCKDRYWNRVRFWNNEAKVDHLIEKIDRSNYGDDNYLTYEDI